MLVTGTGVVGTITVSAVSGTTVTLSSAQTISSTTITFTEYWTGSAWTSTATTLTVDATGIYTVPLAFHETSETKSYYITIEAVSPTTLLSPFMGNIYDNSTPGNVQNPFYIYQYADVTLTLTSAGTNLTVTSNNATSTYTAMGYPNEDSSFYTIPFTVVATAGSNITVNRIPMLEDFTNYDSSDMDWDYEWTSTAIDNISTPKTVTIVGNVYVDRYGSADVTSSLQYDEFVSLASGGSSGGSILWSPVVTGAGGFTITTLGTYDDSSGHARTLNKAFETGILSTTNVAGTGTITGNFYGNTASEITLTISADSAACLHTSTNLSVTKGLLTGTGVSQTLAYTWSAQFDELTDVDSDGTYTIAVALQNEP
jgi:hypothetical protein